MSVSRSLNESFHNTKDGLGLLRVSLILDEPQRIHYGCDDPVHGIIKLRHSPNVRTGLQLFGPLDLDLNLKGVALVTSGTNEIGRIDPRIICSETKSIHRGPFRFEAETQHEFPFSFTFPEHARPRTKTAVEAVQGSDGKWRFLQRVRDVAVDQLPPTCHSLDWQSVTRREILVQYELAVSARMPGIDVNILNPARTQAVYYEQPRVPAAAAALQSEQTTPFNQPLTTQGKHLLPEEDQPQGFKGKMKAMFEHSEMPKYAFAIDCRNFPKHLFVGQPFKFDISLTPNQTQCTASFVPEIIVDSCSVSLIQITEAVTTDISHKQVSNLKTIRSKDADIHPPGPFQKAQDYTKTINVGVVGSVPSTFLHNDFQRNYKIRIVLQLAANGETMRVTRQLSICVHPPLLDDEGHAGPSNQADEAYMAPPSEDGEQLPSYNEAIADQNEVIANSDSG